MRIATTSALMTRGGEDGQDIVVGVPPLVLAEIVKRVGKALRDHDDTAAALLRAGTEPLWSQEATLSAFSALALADLLRVDVVYPWAVFVGAVADQARPERVHTSCVQDEGPVYRLCSTCHRLTADCQPGTPTTCAPCAGTRTA